MTTSDETPEAETGTEWTQAAQRHYDPADDFDLTSEVVTAVAAAANTDPVALDGPPLYDAVDAAALEATLFGSDGRRHNSGSVEFRYLGYRVHVASDGWIRVFERRG
jgi:hypothetical protein